jgi:hypothetical protein
MNVSDFTYLLENPGKLDSPVQTRQLEEVLGAYPWFQAARALHLKGLKNLNSYKYNQALKVTAACTADREVLFDFITSEVFLQNQIAGTLSGKTSLLDQEIASEEVEPNPERDTGLVEKEADSPLPRSAEEADRILDPKLFRSVDPEVDRRLELEEQQQARETLELGKPLTFKKEERHSFSQWLQLTSLSRPGAEGKPKAPSPETGTPDDQPRLRKFELIDRFIADNPKIVPRRDAEAIELDISDSLKIDREELMTETLARVYLEQGKYKKAIQAYRILGLKYPEKSSFFADRIKAVEKLREDKSKQ